VLAACDTAAPGPPAELAVFGEGYPTGGDPCRRSGESAFTSPFLDDAADLVSCPPGVDLGPVTSYAPPEVVAVVEGWTVYSVPRR
ncbi:MAG: hypothetical protein GVY27_06320, partial [Deinococcus-Thermus bacterium]|nr:hypothetical protein [Deinococcota bacterium]